MEASELRVDSFSSRILVDGFIEIVEVGHLGGVYGVLVVE